MFVLKPQFWVKIGFFCSPEGVPGSKMEVSSPKMEVRGKNRSFVLPNPLFFTSKITASPPKFTFFISVFKEIGQTGDFCPKKRWFRPRNSRFSPLKRHFLSFKNPFFPPKIDFNPKTAAFSPKFDFYFSLNVNFCPEIAIFSPKFVPLCPHFLCPKGTFSAPNPNLCSLKRLKLEFLTPK